MIDRRNLLALGASAALAPAIARAAGIDARVRTGTLQDVEHVVILMQENRAFDHYFGAMNGVRGFADRFPIPVAPGRTVWTQMNGKRAVSPFRLNTAEDFALMRMDGTPHFWPDAQAAWDQGRMANWPDAKTDRSMAYYGAGDLPFQYALADAFTVCDAYHCSIQTGTNTNRLFLWTGTNDPTGKGGGPAIGNSRDSLPEKGGSKDSYHWTTYVERLEAAGVSWRVYQDMDDNFSDNPLVGFRAFRDAHAGAPGSNPALADRGVSTRALDGLKADVLAGVLPQVSYIVSTAADSEHPGPSSPAQGADYTARVIDALTADPEVWSRTVLLVMFDENDGFFDHAPPPAPPSRDGDTLLGESTVDTAGEYHLVKAPGEFLWERAGLIGRPYGLGPRVPMYVVSPWSRGGWVNSQVFDHTSVIRFLEARFGVTEPNISPWRRAVCGDLTSAFDFRTPNDTPLATPLPATEPTATRVRAIKGHSKPDLPKTFDPPAQAAGTRPSRALPYALEVESEVAASGVTLRFRNSGEAGAVFHVYDRRNLQAVPRRYTVEAGESLEGVWPGAADAPYDLWVLGPNGFHRGIQGKAADRSPSVRLTADRDGARILITLDNPGPTPLRFHVSPMAYGAGLPVFMTVLEAGDSRETRWPVVKTGGWYDLRVTCAEDASFTRRFAGRLETGKPSISDPAMSGPALMTWD